MLSGNIIITLDRPYVDSVHHIPIVCILYRFCKINFTMYKLCSLHWRVEKRELTDAHTTVVNDHWSYMVVLPMCWRQWALHLLGIGNYLFKRSGHEMYIRRSYHLKNVTIFLIRISDIILPIRGRSVTKRKISSAQRRYLLCTTDK